MNESIKLMKDDTLTGTPERSEYFLAGLNEGGASMWVSKIIIKWVLEQV